MSRWSTEGKLRYDSEWRRWKFHDETGERYGMSCGEGMYLYLLGQWQYGRLEMDTNGWYITDNESSVYLRPKTVYRVRVH